MPTITNPQAIGLAPTLMGGVGIEAYLAPTQRKPPYLQPSTIVTRFQTGHGYTLGSGANGNVNDTSTWALGNQCATIVSKGAGAQAALSNTAVSSFSATAKCIRLTLMIPDATHIAGLSLYLGDTGFANFFLWNVTTANTTPLNNFVSNGDWVTITLNWHDAQITGSPNRAAITNVRVALYDDNTGNVVTAHVNAVETVPDGSALFPNGVVSICFDDGYASPMTLGKPILDQYGYPATTYIIANLVNTSGRATMAQLLNAQEQSGWEIGGHAFTDVDHAAQLANLSPAQLEWDLQNMRAWLISNGFNRGSSGIAFPSGIYNDAVIAVARRYFYYARTICSKPHETFPAADPFRLRSTSSVSSYAGGVSVTQLCADFLKCKANASWMIVDWHDLVTTTPVATTGCLVANFATAIAYLASNQIPVMTVTDVLAHTLS